MKHLSEKTTLGYVSLVWLSILVLVAVVAGIYGAIVSEPVRYTLCGFAVCIASLLAFARVLREWF